MFHAHDKQTQMNRV